MVNETFKLITLGDYIATNMNHNPAFIFVRPSTMGKTHTAKIFCEYIDTAYLLPSASTSKSFESIRMRSRSITTVILDDPHDWRRDDFFEALMLGKHLVDGNLQPSRKTLFTEVGSIAQNSQFVLFCNDDQWDEIFRTLKKIGFLNRAIIIWSTHSKEEKKRIDDFYDLYSYSSTNLPSFEDFEFLNPPREIDLDTINWINNFYSGHPRKTLTRIAQLTTKDQFNEFKPFLISWRNFKFIEEEIKFKIK